MNEMTNQETDTALILENELRRRVKEVVSGIVSDEVARQLDNRFNKHKHEMLMEISIKIGQMLRVIEEEGRQPLWVTGPGAVKEFDHAIHKDTTPV